MTHAAVKPRLQRVKIVVESLADTMLMQPLESRWLSSDHPAVEKEESRLRQQLSNGCLAGVAAPATSRGELAQVN